MPPSRPPARDTAEVERFRPGGVVHALASGLLEAALALVLFGCSQLAGDANPGLAASLVVAAVLWAALSLYSLAVGALRARVWGATLDGDGVVVRGLAGARRWRYEELSAVEIGGGRTRLVARDGRTRRVRGVRGPGQGRRFRARVLDRATRAARRGSAPAARKPAPREEGQAMPATPGRAGPPPDRGGTARGRGFATRAVHGAGAPVPAESPLAVPIWQTSAFAFDDADRYAHALRQPREGFVYTRYENPTTAALEATVANLEAAAQGMATASGMGAIATVLLSLAAAGDHLVVQRDLYGGTFSLVSSVAARLGIAATFVDVTDPGAVGAALQPGTRGVYVETIANPTMAVADLPALAKVAGAAGVPLVVDNTVASPYLCRPIEHGAAVVVHSATKYLGGHSDVVGGLALFADAGLYHRAWRTMIDLGVSPDPFAAWLVLRGVRTLALRMERHTENAGELAKLLAAHPKVERVYWPGLPGHPSHAVAARLLDGYGGFLSFDLAGGRHAGRRFIEATSVARLAPSLGGPETLVSHPASTTHRQLDAAALAEAGIGEGMVRVSAGLEDAEDLLADFTDALEVA